MQVRKACQGSSIRPTDPDSSGFGWLDHRPKKPLRRTAGGGFSKLPSPISLTAPPFTHDISLGRLEIVLRVFLEYSYWDFLVERTWVLFCFLVYLSFGGDSFAEMTSFTFDQFVAFGSDSGEYYLD